MSATVRAAADYSSRSPAADCRQVIGLVRRERSLDALGPPFARGAGAVVQHVPAALADVAWEVEHVHVADDVTGPGKDRKDAH